MTDELESILARVASGELSPEAAEPLVAAVAGRGGPPAWSEAPTTTTPAIDAPSWSGTAFAGGATTGAGPGTGGDAADRGAPADGARPPMAATRAVRIQVTDGGRQVVNLRIPMSLASLAGSVIPGLAEPQVARIQQALRNGERGTILDVRDADGSGVVIATE